MLLAGLLCLGTAAPAKRFSTDDRGNFVVVGNTIGQDCRAPAPVVGDTTLLCGGIITVDPDSGIDGYWRSDFPMNGQATTDNLLSPPGPGLARSTAQLTLPAGATVTYARLYWAALRSAGGNTATIEYPASQRHLDVTAAGADFKTLTQGGQEYFQGSADVTAFVRSTGSGAYRVSGFNSFSLRNLAGVLITSDVTFSSWHLVVFYKLDSEPVRNLTLFDGLDYMKNSSLSSTLSGFLVPTTGAEGRLAVVGYEGDADISGDTVKFNGTALTNALNPANNFFNATRSNLGAAVSVKGDLPQLLGTAGSMSGLDIDLVDITSLVKAGDTTATFEDSSTNDEMLIGTLVTGFASVRPVLSGSSKTFVNTTRSDGRVLPGDVIEYTITVANNGSDPGTNVTVRDVLPAQVTFVPGSLQITAGPNMGNKTDAAGDDQAEYVSNTRTVVARLGTGANATQGGTITTTDAASVFRFRVTVNSGAMGLVANQAQISAQGQTATMQGNTEPSTWPTGNGTTPGAPTVFQVSTCGNSAECPVTAPICDTAATPPQCICRADGDCPTGTICNAVTKTCTQCSPTNTTNCLPTSTGGVCLPGGICGCNTNTDCGGHQCDMTTKTCPAVATDLTVTLTRTPSQAGLTPGSMVTYTVTVKNNGTVPLIGATLTDSFQPAYADAGSVRWTCTASDNAACPASSGSGNLPTAVNLPVGAMLTYTVTTTLPNAQMSTNIEYTVVATPPRGFTDSNPADNIASNSVLVVPGGPDLVVTVTESKSPTDPTVTYTINVHNNGPGVADSATVTYKIPAGSTLTGVMAGDGWECTNTQEQVTCKRTAPIAANADATPIVITVLPPPGATTIPVVVTVEGSDGNGNPVLDPDPSNNTVQRDTPVQQFKLSGGGLAYGCSIGSTQQSAASASAVLVGLLVSLSLGGLALSRSVRRSSRRASLATYRSAGSA